MTSPGQLSVLLCGRAESVIRNKPDLIMTVNGHSDKGSEWSPMGGCSLPGQRRNTYNGIARAACYLLVSSAVLS